MKSILKKFLVIFIALLCFNCGSDDSNEPDMGGDPDPPVNPDPIPGKTTTYEADVKAIMDAQCIRCHTSPPLEGAPFPLRTYQETLIGINRGLVDRMDKDDRNIMPPSGRLPQETIDIILDWDADGLLEN